MQKGLWGFRGSEFYRVESLEFRVEGGSFRLEWGRGRPSVSRSGFLAGTQRVLARFHSIQAWTAKGVVPRVDFACRAGQSVLAVRRV